MLRFFATLLAIALVPALGCSQEPINNANQKSNVGNKPASSVPQSTTGSQDPVAPQSASNKSAVKKVKKMETATFGAGCFWCVEAVFLRLKGVASVKSGYMGGQVDNPTYKMICTGTTGHAEVIQVVYDPEVLSFDTLLEVFWKTHDPTTLNRQGNDVGTQYRSAVFFHSEDQQKKAAGYKKKLNDAKAFPKPIVTEITKASKFYEAEAYHQDFFNNNPSQPYCRAVIPQKLEKLKQVFADKLK